MTRAVLPVSLARWLCLAIAALTPAMLDAQMNVLMHRFDPQRTGAILTETTLTTANVNHDHFGKLLTYPVDGSIMAQPLYVRNVTINGASRDVLFVATMNDKVYAFDATGTTTTPLWMVDFTSSPAVTPVPITDITSAGLNVVGNVGIQSTPVIDQATGALYLVARTKENGAYVQRLHALSIATGQERAGSPVKIAGSVQGTAPDSTTSSGGRIITFDAKMQSQRAGLALVNGVVLIAWAGHEDLPPYHGWIMAYDATSLARVGIMSIAPDAYGGGVWQGGRAPTIDASGFAYFATGNGVWDGTRNFGDSLLKLRADRSGIALVDYFTPGNETTLSASDFDLSGSGFTLLPGTNLLLGGGKEGVLYLLNSANLGKKVANDTQIVQRIALGGGHVMGGPVYWNSQANGPLVYNWSEDDVLKAYRVGGGRLVTTPFAHGQVVSPGHPGGSLTLSAQGSTSGSGIIWASLPTSQDGLHGRVAGVLRAFSADTLQEIWTSEQNASRDRVGTLSKFVPPVVADGRVYLANYDGQVAVYGLLRPDYSLAVAPGGQVIAPGSSGAIQITVAGRDGFSGRVDLSVRGQPTGSTVSFNPASISGSGTSTMTLTVPANAALASSWLTVTGTSGGLTRSAEPLVITVRKGSGGFGAIGIDFVGGSPVGMAAPETAGVVPISHWNNAVGNRSPSPLSVADSVGTPTGALVTWAATDVWMTPIADQPGAARLMKGYLDTDNASTTTVSVTRLSARAYDVYVYLDGDNKSYDRPALYTLTTPGGSSSTIRGIDAGGRNFSSTFTPAANSKGNYVKFRISAGAFTLAATPETGYGTRRAPVNAIEIVPSSSPPSAHAISVDFVGGGTAMASDEVAGVMTRAGWNSAAGAARGAPQVLVDEIGTPTAATITWSASHVWATPITDQPGNRRMMKGYLDTTTASATTIKVAGLSLGTYDVYVYVDGDNRSYARGASYTLTDAGGTSSTIKLTDAGSVNFSGTFTPAAASSGNYVRFTAVGSGFTLTARPSTGDNATLRAPVNGLQIVPRS